MKTSIIVGACLAMCVISVTEAQVVTPYHIVPVIAKAPGGNNTQWVSDVSIVNLSDFAVNLRAGFLREGQAGGAEELYPPVVATIQSGATMIVADALSTWFPGEGDTKGALIILGEGPSQGVDEDVKLAVSSRTYNIGDPRGTFGQTVGSSWLAMVFGRGVSVLPGVRHQQGQFRTNVGIVNMSLNFLEPNAPTRFIVRTYNAAGVMVAEKAVEIEPFSMRQYSLTALGVDNLAAGRTEVMVDPSTITWDPCGSNVEPGGAQGMFIAYMSKVDEGTGDAEFNLGQIDWGEYIAECGEAPSDCDCP